jgi:hypothetical protein
MEAAKPFISGVILTIEPSGQAVAVDGGAYFAVPTPEERGNLFPESVFLKHALISSRPIRGA